MISSIGSFLNPNNLDLTSGANDVIVIRHRDGSLHSTPFNVRFGRMKVLLRGDKTVEVEVNNVKTTAVMKLGDDGGAYWLEPTVDAGYRPESPVDDVLLAQQDVKGKSSEASPSRGQSQAQSATFSHATTDVPASAGVSTRSEPAHVGTTTTATATGAAAELPGATSQGNLSSAGSSSTATAILPPSSSHTGGDDSSKPLLMEDEHGDVTVATSNADPAEVHLAEETVRAANEAMAKLAQRKPHQFLIDAARRDQEDYAQPPMSPQEVEQLQQQHQQMQPQDAQTTEFGPESSDLVSESFLAQRRKSTYDDFLHLFESKAYDETSVDSGLYKDGDAPHFSGLTSSSQPTQSEGSVASRGGGGLSLKAAPYADSIEIAVHKDARSDANGSLSDARSSYSSSSQSVAYNSDEGSDYGHDEVDEYLFQAPVEYDEEEPLETRSPSDSQPPGEGDVNSDSVTYHNDTSPALRPHDDSFNTGSFAGMMNASFNAEVSMYFKRTLIPISADLEKLQLQEGRNTVRYITQTSLRGRVVVEASIYLWDYQDRIVVSDIDGTVTKSDVWGHLLPLFGKDWTHSGICSLYSKISANNYKFVYLSARSVSQVQMTRNFLWNIQQDGVRLPNGPVLTAPQRFFTALTQEVSKRAHLFKIACLESVIDAFPPQTRPFYAGFGNRMNDVVAYTATKIPKHKIFIIDTNSVLHVSSVKQTYKNLAHLVDVTFPPVVRRRTRRISIAPTSRSATSTAFAPSMSDGMRKEHSGSEAFCSDELHVAVGGGGGSGEGSLNNPFSTSGNTAAWHDARGGGGGFQRGMLSGAVVDVLDVNHLASPYGGSAATIGGGGAAASTTLTPGGAAAAAAGVSVAAGTGMVGSNGSPLTTETDGAARQVAPLHTTHYDAHDDDITVEQEFNWCNYWRMDPKQLVSPAPASAGTISATAAAAATAASGASAGAGGAAAAPKPVVSPLDALHAAATKTAPPPRVTTPVLAAQPSGSVASTPTTATAPEGSLKKEGSRSFGSADTKVFTAGDTRSPSTDQQQQPPRNGSFSDLFRRSPFLAPRSSSTCAAASTSATNSTAGGNPPLLPSAVAGTTAATTAATTAPSPTTASPPSGTTGLTATNSQRRFNFTFGLSWKKDSNTPNTSVSTKTKGYMHPSYVELRPEMLVVEEKKKTFSGYDVEGEEERDVNATSPVVPIAASGRTASSSGGHSKWQFWKTTKPAQQLTDAAPPEQTKSSDDVHSPQRKALVEDERKEELHEKQQESLTIGSTEAQANTTDGEAAKQESKNAASNSSSNSSSSSDHVVLIADEVDVGEGKKTEKGKEGEGINNNNSNNIINSSDVEVVVVAHANDANGDNTISDNKCK